MHMVYNSLSCFWIFNEALQAPKFGLPTVDSLFWAVDFGTWMCHKDMGDNYLKFVQHVDACHYAGVDISTYFGSELSNKQWMLWEHWECWMIGLMSSPFLTFQNFLWAEKVM